MGPPGGKSIKKREEREKSRDRSSLKTNPFGGTSDRLKLRWVLRAQGRENRGMHLLLEDRGKTQKRGGKGEILGGGTARGKSI